MKKYINGEYIEMTEQEISELNVNQPTQQDKEQELKDLLARVQELAKELNM